MKESQATTSQNPGGFLSNVSARYPSLLQMNTSLADYSTFGVGGKADYFACAHTEDQLRLLLFEASRQDLPALVIGGGTNLLISDKGYRGLIIKNEIMGISVSGQTITVAAGEEFMALINAASEAALSGLEFAAGIWGTVGGAVVGNAGAYGSEICDVLSEARFVDTEGNVHQKPVSYFEFTYRSSRLKTSGEVITSATVILKPGERKKIESRVGEILAIRASKHPQSANSAGSFFKNIPDPTQPYGKIPAGKLLEEVGAKSLSCGGARVYDKHANILINAGGATSQDIRRLADMLKERVLDKHGIDLEEEVVSIGDFD